jgi:hypothetical protein
VTPEDLVTGSNTGETIENIDLSRCHGSRPSPEETAKELAKEMT